MKRIMTLCAVLMLLISGCSKSDDPQQLLRQAYEKQAKLSSYTYEGTIDISMKSTEEGGSLSVPMNITAMYDNKGTSQTDDDEGYSLVSLSLFGQDNVTESWTVGNTVYTDTGYSKTVSSSETDDSQQDIEEMVSRIIDNAEEITVETDGDNKVMHVTMKEDAVANILSELGEEISEMTGSDDSTRINDVILTIDKDGYIRRVQLSAETQSEGLTLIMDLDLTLKDEGKTVIPAFDPSEFTEEGDDYDYGYDFDDGTDDSYGDSSYEDIIFDDGTEIIVFMDKYDDFMCYFDDDEQLLVLFNEEDVLSDGIFVNGVYAQNLYTAILAGDVTYTIRYERQPDTYGANAKMLVGYSENESELFNAGTPFSVICFDDGDIGLIFVGYGTEEEFKAAMDQLSFAIYTEE